MWLLDESSAVLWDLHQAGVDDGQVANALAHRFGLTDPEARAHVSTVVQNWRAAGLLDSAPFTADDPFDPLPDFPPPGQCRVRPDDWWLTIAQQPVALHIQDANLRARFEALLPSPRDGQPPSDSTATADRVALCGSAERWQLTVNGADVDSGHDADAAVVATLAVLTELGARTRERLLVVHGAGLIAPDGRCLLLVAPGGSGKSTLTVALEAAGCRLLSDDVVPIRADGAALGLGLSMCTKAGSWPVLASARPDLQRAIDVRRFGRTVRFLPPRHSPMTGAVAPNFLLFPEFRPDAEPDYAPLSPELALARLIAADAIIRDLTQQKLETLCEWVTGIPAFSLTYPDLATGISLVHSIIADASPAGS